LCAAISLTPESITISAPTSSHSSTSSKPASGAPAPSPRSSPHTCPLLCQRSCFDEAGLNEAGSAAVEFYVECARTQLQSGGGGGPGGSCSAMTDCSPTDDGLIFALDSGCPQSITDTRWINVAEDARSLESIDAALDSAGCWHDCGADSSGATMDRICDDTSFVQFASVDECRDHCRGQGFACPYPSPLNTPRATADSDAGGARRHGPDLPDG